MDLLKALLSKLNNNKCTEYVLGEKFPLEGYNQLGDHISVALNENSFDVVISLSDLSEQEERAIGDKEFEVFVIAVNYIPFIIMKFGDVFKADMTINVQKTNPDFQNIWFNSDIETVKIFLLEGNDATLKCIRTITFENMDFVKSICKKQLKLSKTDIDEYINYVYQQVSIEQMMQFAQVHFVVPAAITI